MGNQACCGNPKWRGKEARDEEESSYSDNGTISSAGFPGDENFPALPGVVVETIYHHKTKRSHSRSTTYLMGSDDEENLVSPISSTNLSTSGNPSPPYKQWQTTRTKAKTAHKTRTSNSPVPRATAPTSQPHLRNHHWPLRRCSVRKSRQS
mmetsp:Transcript_1952/g.2700  ORF Transcript_1952/g.2700 Transcript_1952/m.2700 type:complete len:151 (-) Transcript_1952:196-648(-)|eukprot:913791-Amorphochlora_amoeboformis.AAC.1